MATVAIQTNPVSWFEIPVKDIARASKFFESVFGLKLNLQEEEQFTMAWFPMIQGAPGAAGSLVKADNYVPSHAGTIVYFSVDDIDEALMKIKANGGKVLLPKISIGEYGFIAHFEDTEGNKLALHAVK